MSSMFDFSNKYDMDNLIFDEFKAKSEEIYQQKSTETSLSFFYSQVGKHCIYF